MSRDKTEELDEPIIDEPIIDEHAIDEHSIAVLSMACRFPGAADPEAFWRNLRAGVESIAFFTAEELEAAGNDPALVRHPSFVKAHPALDGVELFDAPFFDMSPREAEILDPQCRLFLECAWEALERAGYAGDGDAGWIGVFAGASASNYLIGNLQTRPDVYASQGWFPIYLANDRDYFTTRVSYKLGLRGPSLNIQTACSTSLVAVHQACQSLLDYQCNLALAGGARLAVPQTTGYFYEPGGITSPDGHCRPFDARAAGSLFGSGVGVVVLKRLAEALADGDPIAAVIRGSAVNNDGAAKVGFTAPSVAGQAEVIAMAQAAAGVDPATITYVEAHGSATALGDPIEVAALTDAFRAGTEETGFCALGSVKSNVGHLEAAAGVAGLIKTVLALRHREIPPTLHYEEPNPQIDFAASPFFVNAELRPWQSPAGPRRAGVSSFGMGGTNAHVVVEEAPASAPSGPSRPWQLVTVSARTATAADALTRRLAEHLADPAALDPGARLADVAYTLQLGRRAFEHRRVAVCRDPADAAAVLAGGDGERLLRLAPSAADRQVAFLLPGLGEHYPGMGRGLYDAEPAFRAAVDRCAEVLAPHLGEDLRRVLYPEAVYSEEAAAAPGDGRSGLDLARMIGRAASPSTSSKRLLATRFAHPALFTLEYALAELWQSWGIRPQALLGHSLGEYVAATLAGVFTLEDALALVAERARLIAEQPAGAMLAVSLAEGDVLPLLAGELCLAAVNAPEVTVVGGPRPAVEALRAALAARGIVSQLLPTTHAFHSPALRPAAAALTDRLRRTKLRPPSIPFLSNVTGRWITPQDAVDPAYWGEHLCRPVRFADGVGELLRSGDRVLLEVGPGHGLGALVLQHPAPDAGQRMVVPSLRSRFDRADDQAFLLGALGRLWLAGVRVDWPGFWAGEERRRVELPTYPFERRRYWVEPGTFSPRSVATATTQKDGAEGDDGGGAGTAVEAPRLTSHDRPALLTAYAPPATELERRIVEVWQEVLGIAPIGVDDSYFDMGGHSLMAPRLVTALEQELGLALPLATFLEHPTVARLAAAVERARSDDGAALAAQEVDLRAEVTLDGAVRPVAAAAPFQNRVAPDPPPSNVRVASAPTDIRVAPDTAQIRVAPAPVSIRVAPRPAAVLLTGGTGFLGAFLLRELCERTDATVYCLVRAEHAGAARDRLRRNLERFQVWSPEVGERIVPLAGDLALPTLGLGEPRFAELATTVDAVYHAGAWVNFTYPYTVLRPANVDGTREALRLAATARTKPFHFVSSTAVFTPASFTADGRALEDAPLADTAGLFSGYAETKWVAEKVLAIARDRGLPVAIYRPGVISGHTATGAGNTSDMVWNVIKGSLQLGGALDLPDALDVTPVDYVARAIVELSLREDALGRTFHFASPAPMPWREVFDVLRDLGYPLRRLNAEEWRREMRVAVDAGVENALTPFLPLFTAADAPAQPPTEGAAPALQIRFDDRNTRELLAGSGVVCPPIDAALIRAYMEHFVACGFLTPPSVPAVL